MKIKNLFTGEIKDFDYDFMGKAEAKRLLSTGQWKKMKNGGAMGYNSGLPELPDLGGNAYSSFGDDEDDDENDGGWGY